MEEITVICPKCEEEFKTFDEDEWVCKKCKQKAEVPVRSAMGGSIHGKPRKQPLRKARGLTKDQKKKHDREIFLSERAFRKENSHLYL